MKSMMVFFFFQAEDGIRDPLVTGVQTCALPISRFLETLKQAQVKTVIEYERLQKFSASTAIWLCIREEDALDDLEQEDLKAWLDAHPTLARAFQLIQDFLVMVHQREGHRLDVWLQQVEVSTIPELHSFARCGWNGIKPLSRLG